MAHDPEWIRIESVAQNRPQVEQVYFEVDRRSKLEALTRLIDLNDFRYGIIFCSTKVMVDELDEHLHARGYAVDRLHGDISQAQRDRVMAKFRERKFEFLVATDVAARGLDVDDLEVVFNYDLPNDAEDYTHRIGRTGRAGRSGRAFTFVSGREIYKLRNEILEAGDIGDVVKNLRESVFTELFRNYVPAETMEEQWDVAGLEKALRALPALGTMGVDFEERVDYRRLHKYRIGRARQALEKSDLGALLVFDVNNIRYLTSTKIGEWERDKLSRWALLPLGLVTQTLLWQVRRTSSFTLVPKSFWTTLLPITMPLTSTRPRPCARKAWTRASSGPTTWC